ncbi:MAG: alanine--tRNA ligase [Clostridia bacterium]|nr:alanine--tRNA ligase [Clostridia bacterium]
MKWTGLNELREKYLEFFESKGHLRLQSFPLIPQNDNSLLLINSGMAPMKKYFTGEITPPRTRVTTCQKCIRTPDIERVGKTARHGTYFEMLGNFSFGDYFKHEATAWAWEFCTKVMELPVDRLWVSIYEDDDEAFDIWTKEVGVSPDRIVRLGKADNFWEHGAGPCGPCSEIYFDRGEKYGCGSPDCAVGCECDRFVEFWNLVFTQFENDGNNNYTPLQHPNIDTGMGLERLACIMQDVNNLFEVDTVQNIMKHISKIANVHYGDSEKTDVSLRVITDHIRSTTFMVGDGVMPSNEGRGYVLRRLLRRAARHGRLLGINRPFLSEVCDTVIDENANAYPELQEKRDFIKKLIKSEEESFEKTIDQGLGLLSTLIESVKDKTLSGAQAFKLYDTYGFPLDLTRDILEEKGISVDEDEFDVLMKEQRDRARGARKNAGAQAWEGDADPFADVDATKFVGYTEFENDAEITAIVIGAEKCSSAVEGAQVMIALDTTAFYAESGGQVGDSGVIESDNATVKINRTFKNADNVFIHEGEVVSGTISVGDKVKAIVDAQDRKSIMRNHTAAHLLQHALRQVLGTHVEQAGQLVTAKSVRFDFTHFSAMTADELSQVETLVNEYILAADAVTMTEMPIEEAKKLGAMALFGEKYGDTVRVVKAGNSIELCGGTHIDNTSKLGLFHIISEGSVASGVRRIEAVTGQGVLEFINIQKGVIDKVMRSLKLGSATEIQSKIEQNISDLKAKEAELRAINEKLAAQRVGALISAAKEVCGVKVIAVAVADVAPDALRTMTDNIKANAPDAVAVLAAMNKEKGTVTFASAVGKNALAKGAHAGNLVREVAKVTGGNGGGKPDAAMAGGKDISKVDEALMKVSEIVESQVNKG